jgi:mannose-6-phosphate isomerase-like protein (cupin superfamily)
MKRSIAMWKPLAVLLALSTATALAAADNETPLPAVYKNAAELMATLARNAQTATADQASAPVVNSSHYRINIVRRDRPGTAMAHASGPAKGSELHYIIDGAATVVTGGELVRPQGASATRAGGVTIEGGESRRVAKGDVIFIPAGTPHWYKEVEGSVTYLEVRFDVELKK